MNIQQINLEQYYAETNELKISKIISLVYYWEIAEQVTSFNLEYNEEIVENICTGKLFRLIDQKYKEELDFIEIVISKDGFIFDFHKFLPLYFSIRNNEKPLQLNDYELAKEISDEVYVAENQESVNEENFMIDSFYFKFTKDDSIRHLFLSGKNIIVNGIKCDFIFKPHNYFSDEPLEDVQSLSGMVNVIDKLNRLTTYMDTTRTDFALGDGENFKKVLVVF